MKDVNSSMNSELRTMNKYLARVISFLVIGAFLCSTVLPAWATPSPSSSHLRPTASDGANRDDLVRELQNAKAARDGSNRKGNRRFLDAFERQINALIFGGKFGRTLLWIAGVTALAVSSPMLYEVFIMGWLEKEYEEVMQTAMRADSTLQTVYLEAIEAIYRRSSSAILGSVAIGYRIAEAPLAAETIDGQAEEVLLRFYDNNNFASEWIHHEGR